MIDYRDLLLRYMTHIVHLEGSTFQPDDLDPDPPVTFTETERLALVALGQEAHERHDAWERRK